MRPYGHPMFGTDVREHKMQALTVEVGKSDSLQVDDIDEPTPGPGELLVKGLAVGVCGTDKEIVRGEYGWAPPGRDKLVLGHESLGQVERAPQDSQFASGDLVVGVVRRPDPVPCGACGHGEFDMCRNGRYTERGIKERDGYGSQRWCVETDYAVRLDPHLAEVGVLMEPTTVVAKAWEQVHRIGQRAWFEPARTLVTGAGPIGLLAAMLSVQQGLDTHVLDRVTAGPKPDLVSSLGATYHSDDINDVARRLQPDLVIEATGAPALVFGAITNTSTYGIVCLTGVSPTGRRLKIDAGAVNREVVLENDAVVGSVNANLRHYHQAADALAKADARWLARMITRRVPLHRAPEAFDARDDDVKVVIDLDERG
jgi:glucose 1-dehydrogenase